jgi:hypothetical protein
MGESNARHGDEQHKLKQSSGGANREAEQPHGGTQAEQQQAAGAQRGAE